MCAIEVAVWDSPVGRAPFTIRALIAICNRSELVFAEAIDSAKRPEFRESVGRVRQLLHEFGFQLRTELQRLEDDPSKFFAYEREPTAATAEDSPSSMRQILDAYEQVLGSNLPPHTRAMVKRQHDQLRGLCEEFKQFVTVLETLIDARIPASE